MRSQVSAASVGMGRDQRLRVGGRSETARNCSRRALVRAGRATIAEGHGPQARLSRDRGGLVANRGELSVTAVCTTCAQGVHEAVRGRRPPATLLARMKRTYQPKKRKRARTHGF